MSSIEQLRHEGLCLRYPENLGQHPNITYEIAVSMLVKAAVASQTVPFQWGWIDRPAEGQVFLVFIGGGMPGGMPGSAINDGIRYQEVDNRYVIPAENNRELEITESKYGFIPSHPSSPSPDSSAWRVRRRFRLTKGGHPQLVLIHYGRGIGAPIMPSLASQPIRAYPLRQINEPGLYVAGEKAGQKVLPGNQRMGGMVGGGGVGPHNMLAQQNREMEALERRSMGGMGGGMAGMPGRPRSMSGTGGGMPGASVGRGQSMGAVGQPQGQVGPRIDDDDDDDETDQISTRTLATTRYKRNHELMNEVFMYAAFGDPVKRAELSTKKGEIKPKPAFGVFDTKEMEDKVMKLNEEIARLEVRGVEIRAKKAQAEAIGLGVDVNMEEVFV